MSDRDPVAILFEADYWRAVISDGRGLNDLVGQASDALAPAVHAVLECAFTSPSPIVAAALDRIMLSVNETMSTLAAMQPPIRRIAELSGGRVKVLRVEAGLDEEPDDEC